MRTISEPARAKRRDLPRRALGVGRIGIGHRLDDDRRAAADDDAADVDGEGGVALGLAREWYVSACLGLLPVQTTLIDTPL